MNTTANHLNAQLVAARCCDALEPCESCRSTRTRYAAIRHAERVAAMTLTTPAPRVPAQRIGSLRERLLTA
jgi:hypothetical protein